MVDTHAHLNFKAFADDLPPVLDRAKKAGVNIMVVVGAALDSSLRAVTLAGKHEMLYAAVGIHPHHVDKLPEGWLQALTRAAQSHRVVAVGEIGLDYHAYATNGMLDKKLQREVFVAQMDLAIRLGKPVILHCREAWEDLLPLVAQYNKQRGVFHCWSGSLSHAHKALELGSYISFAGNLTYPATWSHPGGTVRGPTPKPERLLSPIQQVAQTIPLDHILLETDCPFLAPHAKRGLRNEPSFVTITAAFLAKLRGVPLQEIDRATTQNANALFRFRKLTT